MNAELLKKLVTTPGISGREERIRELIKGELAPLVDEVKVDTMGNIIAIRDGSGPRVMLEAHMDSIGFLVKHIEDDGFVRVAPVGGFDPRTLVNQRVMVHGKQDYPGLMAPSSKPIHLSTPEDANKAPKIEEIFVDLMMPADEVKANVSVGDPITLCREPIATDQAFTSPYLDDRLGCYVLVEAMRAIQDKEVHAEIFAVACVQEEVGLRGAKAAAYSVDPDMGVALDITLAMDIPGADRAGRITSLGQGVAIKYMDGASISDPRLVNKFKELAEQQGIPHQFEILPRGGTDAGGMQLARAGTAVITISQPIRYTHTSNEMAYNSDIDASVNLVAAFLEHAHEVQLKW